MFEAGALASPVAQEVKFTAAHVRMAVNDNLFDARRARQESAFHTDAIAGYAANGEVGIVTAIVLADDRTLEFLGAFGVAFFDAQENTYHVAGAELRYIFVRLGLNGLDNFAHNSTLTVQNAIPAPSGDAEVDYITHILFWEEQIELFGYSQVHLE